MLSELWAACGREMGNPTLLEGIEGIWCNDSTACSEPRVTDGGNLLQAAPAETGTKVQPEGVQAPPDRGQERRGRSRKLRDAGGG